MRKFFIIGAVGVLFIASIVFFFFFDPNKTDIFPKCPFLQITGYECPGCGSQRALYHLLHLKIGQAFSDNALPILFFPYFFTGIYLEYFGGNTKFPALRPLLFGKQAAIIALSLIFMFWILRNINFG